MSQLYPVGSILPYGGAITLATETDLINAGYIPCDGRALAKGTPKYAALYALIADSYGGDDNSFCVPDYRGRFLRGTDNGAGRDPDAQSRTSPNPTLKFPGNTGDHVGSLQSGGVQAHIHEYGTQNGPDDWWHDNLGGAEQPGVLGAGQMTVSNSTEAGHGETRPKNAYINFVIVYL